jgi:hypothetical protein
LKAPRTVPLGVLGTFGVGSGKFGTPWERMQRAKASAPFSCADAAGVVAEELPPHAAATTVR